MKWIFKLIVEILKLLSPIYWITRKTADPDEQERQDAETLLDVLKHKKDD